MNLGVEKHILTYNYGHMNYDRLNQDLKNKWLKGYNENDQLKIQHFTDFLKAFHEEHKHLLNQTEKDLLKKKTCALSNRWFRFQICSTHHL